MDTLGIEQMLSALRTTAAQASGKAAESTPTAGGADFAQILQGSIDKVNQTQMRSRPPRSACSQWMPMIVVASLGSSLAAGDTTQNLHEVMIALQTASVSFQEMVQVRNKIVSAYQDVMNMQV